LFLVGNFRKGPSICEVFEVDGEEIKSLDSLKALRITLQSDLKWNRLTQHVTAKLSQKLAMLKKITKNFSR